MIKTNLALLRAKGYKLTPQRQAVLQAFSECSDFPTAQQIFTIVRKTHPSVSFDTIYRNLALLAKIGIVHEIHRTAGNVYEIIQPGHHHHHIVCTECGKTECIDICPMQDSYAKEAEKKGFLITNHIFEFYGLCQNCRKKLENKFLQKK